MKTTLQELTDVIQQDINEELADVAMFEEVKKALKPFIGKPFTKRMDTALKKHFEAIDPDCVVYVERMASLINVIVKRIKWPGQSDYRAKNGYSLLIGYSDTETYQEGSSETPHSGINYFSLSWGAAALKRIEQNRKMLRSPAKLALLAEMIDMQKKVKSILDQKHFSSWEFPARYEIDRHFKLKEER